MTSKSETHRDSAIGAEILSRVAPTQHQLECVLTPEMATADIVGLSSDFIGRPISKWSKEPKLAQVINDRLSRAVHLRLA